MQGVFAEQLFRVRHDVNEVIDIIHNAEIKTPPTIHPGLPDVFGLVVLVVEKQLMAVAAAAAGDDFYSQEHFWTGLGPFLVTL